MRFAVRRGLVLSRSHSHNADRLSHVPNVVGRTPDNQSSPFGTPEGNSFIFLPPTVQGVQEQSKQTEQEDGCDEAKHHNQTEILRLFLEPRLEPLSLHRRNCSSVGCLLRNEVKPTMRTGFGCDAAGTLAFKTSNHRHDNHLKTEKTPMCPAGYRKEWKQSTQQGTELDEATR